MILNRRLSANSVGHCALSWKWRREQIWGKSLDTLWTWVPPSLTVKRTGLDAVSKGSNLIHSDPPSHHYDPLRESPQISTKLIPRGRPPTCLGDQTQTWRRDDVARMPQNRYARGGQRYNRNSSDLEYWPPLPNYTSHSSLRPAGYHGDRLGSSVHQPSGVWACGWSCADEPPLSVASERAGHAPSPLGSGARGGRAIWLGRGRREAELHFPGVSGYTPLPVAGRRKDNKELSRRPVRGYLGPLSPWTEELETEKDKEMRRVGKLVIKQHKVHSLLCTFLMSTDAQGQRGRRTALWEV